MNVIETIKTRRSIRQFIEREIEKEKLDKILSSAMHAPSAHNEQPWEFILIDDKNLLKQIANFHHHANMAKMADKGILVCHNKKAEKIAEFWVQDLSAATQNILLTAHFLDIGSVWTGIYPFEHLVKNFKDFFSLPDHIIPFSFIPLGYYDKKKFDFSVDRYDKKKVHVNNL